mgnify:CR=1 FL=1
MASNGKRNNNRKPRIVRVKVRFSWKNLFLYGFIFLFLIFLFTGLSNQQSFEGTQTVPLSRVISDVKAGKVSQISVSDTKLTITEKNETLQSFKEPQSLICFLFFSPHHFKFSYTVRKYTPCILVCK